MQISDLFQILLSLGPASLLCIVLAGLLWYFIGLYAYTREITEALCEADDHVRLRSVESAMEVRFLTIAVLGPLTLLLDFLTLGFDSLHPERHVRSEKKHAEWRREVGWIVPGQTSPLLAHGPRPTSDERRRACEEAARRVDSDIRTTLARRRAARNRPDSPK